MSAKFYQFLKAKLLFLLLFATVSMAQQKFNLSNTPFSNSFVHTEENNKITKEIKFNDLSGISFGNFIPELKKAFGLSNEISFKVKRKYSDKLKQTHYRMKEYYKGIPVEDQEFILHEKNGVVNYANGILTNYFQVNTTPQISEEQAFQTALSFIGAQKYMWEDPDMERLLRADKNDKRATYYPKANLVIVRKLLEKNFKYYLAYRFDIYSLIPSDRNLVDVDAISGKIINKIPKIYNEDVQTQGVSYYDGTVPILVGKNVAPDTLLESKWHLSNWNAYNGLGQSWWVADEASGLNGYENHWYEVLDSDPINLTGTNLTLTFYQRYAVETPGGEPAGFDGWDGMNVRISTDNGSTWQVLTNPTPAYTSTSLFSFGDEFSEGTGIPGWAGENTAWTKVTFDLNNYSGQTVKIRFAFSADPGFSTLDDPSLFGWQIDDIDISNSNGSLFSNNGVQAGLNAKNLVQPPPFIAGTYRLRETSRGGGIQTFDMKHSTNLSNRVDFVSEDSVFNSENSKVGVSVHWGVEQTYDYYFQSFSRNSFDDAGGIVRSYAHFDNSWFNAQWDGANLRFGDGTSNSSPLVTIDIVAHEFTHGVTQYTADLIYFAESGALNESFSDVFGTSAEFFALGSAADWLMGRGAVQIRSMSNPNAFGNPDTYKGQFWAPLDGADNGGVHTNSGVQNFWYYLLSEGGSGVNDFGKSYSVVGIGIDKAGQIAYRNLAVYLTPSSDYSEARLGSMNAAIDLYGRNSQEFNSVVDAWDAVGVLFPQLSPTISVVSDTLNFTAETNSNVQDTIDFIISNLGLDTLKVESLQLTGSAFSFVSNPSLPIILPGFQSTATIKIIFDATQEGLSTGTLTVGSNDNQSPSKTITLLGNGYVIHPAVSNIIYASSGIKNQGKLLQINLANGLATEIGPSSFKHLDGIAIDHLTKIIYGIYNSDNGVLLLRVNATAGDAYEKFNLNLSDVSSIGFDNSNNLYATQRDGKIYQIDLSSGTTNFVSQAKVGIESFAFDPNTNDMWVTNPFVFGLPKDKIYKVDISTGDTVLVGHTGINNLHSALFFNGNGDLYGVVGINTRIAQFISIDLNTALGTIIGSVGVKEITGLAALPGIITDVADKKDLKTLPKEFQLSQNYPNPFNPSTTINYALPVSAKVSVKIFNILGEQIAQLFSGEQPAGFHSIVWNSRNSLGQVVSSGIYFYSLIAEGVDGKQFNQIRKMVLLK